jgi:hypothetical protein
MIWPEEEDDDTHSFSSSSGDGTAGRGLAGGGAAEPLVSGWLSGLYAGSMLKLVCWTNAGIMR